MDTSPTPDHLQRFMAKRKSSFTTVLSAPCPSHLDSSTTERKARGDVVKMTALRYTIKRSTDFAMLTHFAGIACLYSVLWKANGIAFAALLASLCFSHFTCMAFRYRLSAYNFLGVLRASARAQRVHYKKSRFVVFGKPPFLQRCGSCLCINGRDKGEPLD